jgi:DNA primase
MDFKDQLKSTLDIVHVVGDYVRLKKSGAQRYLGLCPFHNEKTPSFTVHAARQFYKCFGCGEGGDIFSFVQKVEGISFYEALTLLAERNGIAIPKRTLVADEESQQRETLFQMHEIAIESFRSSLRGPAGQVARAYLDRRGVSPATAERFGIGYSEASWSALTRLLEKRGFPADRIEQSGLVRRRDEGGFYDYFRNRLMFPIHNESGKVIGFGGRALSADDNPKYLNSPETPIYTKSRVLYNLHRAKEAIRKEDRVVLVEGYMDVVGVSAAGFAPVVASCGTALTDLQTRTLKRHSEKILVNFDPDAPGSAAAERSLGLLLQEGMTVRIVTLDGGLDPDEYCKERGADAYRAALDGAKGYFYWLADRARARHDVRTTEGLIAVLRFLMPAVERISDRLERMAVANDVAEYIGVDRGMVLDSFRKAAATRREDRIVDSSPAVRPAEKGLLNVLLSDVQGREQLMERLEGAAGMERLETRRIFQAILAAHKSGVPVTFDGVSARLDPADRNLLAGIALTEDAEAHEMSLAYGESCLEAVLPSEAADQRARLKARIREAERAGNLEEALRLNSELRSAETLR